MSQEEIHTLEAVVLPERVLSKMEIEQRAFRRLLPELLKTHLGQYVAIHDEQVVDSGTDEAEVGVRTQQRIGNVPIYVGLVTDKPEWIARSGIIRDLSANGWLYS